MKTQTAQIQHIIVFWLFLGGASAVKHCSYAEITSCVRKGTGYSDTQPADALVLAGISHLEEYCRNKFPVVISCFRELLHICHSDSGQDDDFIYSMLIFIFELTFICAEDNIPKTKEHWVCLIKANAPANCPAHSSCSYANIYGSCVGNIAKTICGDEAAEYLEPLTVYALSLVYPNCSLTDYSPAICASSACLNGGRCYMVASQPMCFCRPSYAGTICESTQVNQGSSNDFCSPNPCLNHGICYATADMAYCLCVPGFWGIACEKRMVTEDLGMPANCTSSSCLNGGTCSLVINGARCACPVEYSGEMCELKPTNRPVTQIVIFVAGGVAVVMIISVMVMSCVFFRKLRVKEARRRNHVRKNIHPNIYPDPLRPPAVLPRRVLGNSQHGEYLSPVDMSPTDNSGYDYIIDENPHPREPSQTRPQSEFVSSRGAYAVD